MKTHMSNPQPQIIFEQEKKDIATNILDDAVKQGCMSQEQYIKVKASLFAEIEAPGNEWGTVVKILDLLQNNRTRGSVLVHCCGAVSRSPFVVLCYMVIKEKMTIDQASRKLSYLHPTTNINLHLIELLKKNEASTRP